MNKRQFLTGCALVKLSGRFQYSQCPRTRAEQPVQRLRPSDPRWPSAEEWETLNRAVDGKLTKVQTPLSACREPSGAEACTVFFKQLKNPYFVGDQPGVTQTHGWVDGWTSAPSAYAVGARQTRRCGRRGQLRARQKSTPRDQGRRAQLSRHVERARLADHLDPCDERHRPARQFRAARVCGAAATAVTVGAGAIWIHAYDAVTTKGGRYAQGGGCTTVGVAGLIQGGGFGSFSKNYGTAAATLLEAEIVTADGKVRIANACNDPDLFGR